MTSAASKSGNAIAATSSFTFKINDERKYVVAGATIYDASGIFYRENTATGTWKFLRGTQAVIPCSDLSAKEKEILKGLENCSDSDGTNKIIGY